MSDPRPNPEIAHLRVPPHSVEAEQSVLGGLLLDNSGWDRCGDVLLNTAFYGHQHRLIYGAIGHLINANRPADIFTVYERLQEMARTDKFADQIDMAYLNSMAASVPSAANIRAYAEIVASRHAERLLIAATDEAATLAWNGDGTPAEKLERIVSSFGILEGRNVTNKPRALEQLLIERLDSLTARHEGTEPLGWATGMSQVDKLLKGGLHPGRMYLLGGRPGMGKSSIALSWSLDMALGQDLSGQYFSQEMPEAEVTDRAICKVANVSYDRFQMGKLFDAEWGRVSEAIERMTRISFHIDATTGLGAGDIGMRVRYVKGVKVVVLDYVQLCRGLGETESNRNNELSLVSRTLKTLAKSRECAMLVLSGLNRKADERPYRRPIMNDFRDCGQLEADADAILTLFPLRALDSRGIRIMGLDVIKNRQGALGCVALDFQPEMMWWGESEYSAEELLKPDKRAQAGGDL